MRDLPGILLVDSGTVWRGGQQQVWLLARELQSRGIPVHLTAPNGSSLAARAAEIGIGWSPMRGINDLDLLAARRLAIITREAGAGIVHCHDSRSHAIAFLARWFGNDQPLVVSRRSLGIPRPGAKYRSVNRFIAVSRAVERSLAAAGVASDRIDVVHSGIDPPSGGSRPRMTSPDPFRAVACGALEDEKGIPTLLAAAALLKDAGVPVEWTVVGDGSRRRKLERTRQKLGAPVTFVGWQESVGEFIDAADVLVHPSRSEAFGTVILEALWRGKPVIATRVGGIPEILDESVGAMVAPDEPMMLANAVRQWLQDPNARDEVRKRGPWIASKFGVAAMADGTIASYRKTLEQVNAKGSQ